MSEFHENIKSVAEAVAKFKAIPPERMNGVPAIGIRAADPKDPDEYKEMDVLIGRRIDMDMLRYIPEIADNWQAQQMIASLIHEMLKSGNSFWSRTENCFLTVGHSV